MTLRDVVRRDVRNALRTRSGISTFVLVVVGAALPASLVLRHLAGREPTALTLIFTRLAPEGITPGEPDILIAILALVLGLFLPLVSLVVSYNAILVEREQRTIKLLLGLPNSRSDAFVGKVLARSAVVVAPLLVGLLVVAVVSAIFVETVPVGKLAGLAALGTLLVLCFVALGVVVSAAAKGGRRAVALALGSYLLLGPFWRVWQFGYYGYRNGGLSAPGRYYPQWLYATDRLSPVWAFEAATGLLLGPELDQPFVVEAPAGSIFASGWLPIASLIAWSVVLLVVGYLAFERADLS